MSNIQNNINKLPEELKDSVKTEVKSLSKIISDKLQAMKDLATLEVFMPVSARAKERIKTIKEMGSAKSIKINGHWKTDPPKMHIAKLENRKINNDHYELRFSVFDSDKKGNKKLFENTTSVTLANGDTIKRATSAQYNIAYEVTETIKQGKAITREVIKIDAPETN